MVLEHITCVEDVDLDHFFGEGETHGLDGDHADGCRCTKDGKNEGRSSGAYGQQGKTGMFAGCASFRKGLQKMNNRMRVIDDNGQVIGRGVFLTWGMHSEVTEKGILTRTVGIVKMDDTDRVSKVEVDYICLGDGEDL